jgi:3-phenylpropionate/trans-cinnamate dioxygenase ferredoxin subunit
MNSLPQPVRVAGVDDIPEGSAITVHPDVTGASQPIAVFNDEGNFFALDDTCTHEDASLADGWIENGEVECPMHSGRFCLATGEALCLPLTRNTRAYSVDVREGDVWLTQESSAS